MRVSGITSPTCWSLLCTAHLNKCMPVTGLTLVGLDWGTMLRCWIYARKRSKCASWNIIHSWEMECPAKPCLGQSLWGWMLVMIVSYCLWGFADKGGMAWSVWGNSRALLWYENCCTHNLCQIWSLVITHWEHWKGMSLFTKKVVNISKPALPYTVPHRLVQSHRAHRKVPTNTGLHRVHRVCTALYRPIHTPPICTGLVFLGLAPGLYIIIDNNVITILFQTLIALQILAYKATNILAITDYYIHGVVTTDTT